MGRIFQKQNLLSRGLSSFYDALVIDHYEHPRNVGIVIFNSELGTLDKNSKNVGTGLVGAPACGDVMRLQVFTKYNYLD